MKKVRANKIPSPNRYGTTLEQWESGAKKIGAPENFINAGLKIIEFKDAVNLTINTSKIFDLDKSHLIRKIVEFANRNFVVLNDEFKATEHKVPITYTVKGNEPSKLSPDTLITKMIDALRFGLCSANERCTGAAQATSIEVFSQFDLCAQMMENCSSIWMEFIWNDWQYEDGKFIEPFDTINLLREGNSLRRNQFEIASFMQSQQVFQKYPAIKPEAIVFGREGRKLKAKRSKIADSSLYAIGRILGEIYYQPLKQTKGNFGFSLKDIEEVWECLSAYSQFKLAELAGANGEINALSDLGKFEVKIKKANLIELLSDFTKLNNNKVDAILSFLTFDFDYKTNLWDRPLIQIGDYLHFAIAVFYSAKPRFLIESWIHRIGIDEKEKGKEFESFVQAKISEITKENGFIKLLTLDNLSEEIDLIFSIGETIWVGELKCNKEPVEADDYYNYRSDLEKASQQLKRKIAYLESAIDPLAYGAKCISKTGLIVSNCFMYSGLKIEESVVIDYVALFNYLKDNYFVQNVIVNGSGLASGSKILFYKNEAEMEAKFESFLSKIPQVFTYVDKLSQVDFPVTVNDQVIFQIQRPAYSLETIEFMNSLV